MKRIVLLLIMVPLFSLAQTPERVSTSMEEYTYLTKGLKSHIEEGQDVKRGYVLKKSGPVEFDGISIIFGSLKDEQTSKVKAIFFVVKEGKKSVYLCLPINNDELNGSFVESVLKLDKKPQNFLNSLIATLLAKNVDECKNK